MNKAKDMLKIGLVSLILNACSPYQQPNLDTEIIDAFTPMQEQEYKELIGDNKFALALITTSDHNNATKGMEEMFQNDFQDIPGYSLITTRSNRSSILNNIRDHGHIKPIDTLILAYHGDPNGFAGFTKGNIPIYFAGYERFFAPNAIILLYSCEVGKQGEFSVANAIANTINRDVMAPKYVLIPETDISTIDRKGEFSLNKEQQVIFDETNFTNFRRVIFMDDMYLDVVATNAYKHKAHTVIAKHEESFADLFYYVDK